mgnify:CR=1 FL=1
MSGYIEGKTNSKQYSLIPTCYDEMIAEDNPVRVLEAFVDSLNLKYVCINSLEGLSLNVANTGVICSLIDAKNDKDISEKFENNLITFREDIGADRKNIDLLKKQLQTVFNKLNISFIFSDDYCEKIKNYSELAIRRKSTEEII